MQNLIGSKLLQSEIRNVTAKGDSSVILSFRVDENSENDTLYIDVKRDYKTSCDTTLVLTSQATEKFNPYKISVDNECITASVSGDISDILNSINFLIEISAK